MFYFAGAEQDYAYKRNTLTLYEAIKFINFVKNNIRFLSMDYDSLIESAKKENYSYLDFSDGVSISKYVGEKVQREFLNFTGKIGTTDSSGQLSICDEYIEIFKEFYKESVKNEKGKVNVVGAISVLSVVCVLILGG